MGMEDWPVAEVAEEHRRAAILKLLLDSRDNEATAEAMAQAARAFGILTSKAEIEASLGWLEARELVTTETHPFVVIGKLTRQGKEVARGHHDVPGVARVTELD